MIMKLIEFKNHLGDTLRGIISETDSKKAILCVHGFERTSMEYKFKNILNAVKDEFIVFRFDFSGCILSEGNFEDVTLDKLSQELNIAYKKLISLNSNIDEVILVGHSISGCTIAKWILDKNPELVKKNIFLGPAWNEKEILKYFYVRAKYKGKIDINWKNYPKYFDPKEYQTAMNIELRERVAHYITNNFFKENKDQDYSQLINKLPQKKLCIHGLNDKRVPIESIDYTKLNVELIKVDGGDHDLEKPKMVEQYLDKLVDFIKK